MKQAQKVVGYILDNTGHEVTEQRIVDLFESYDNEDNYSIIEVKEELLGDILVEDYVTCIDNSSSVDGTIYYRGIIVGFMHVSMIDRKMMAEFNVSANHGYLTLSGDVLKVVSERIEEYNGVDIE